jgi:uncharacterized protein with ParB-like and HNH nuclease domain
LTKLKDIFDAQALSPTDVARHDNGVIGYRIPDYQRDYDWSEVNINRLFTDCLIGFENLQTGENSGSFTFLGTIISVTEENQELEFGGKSVAIVDGQQRLTTLALLACAVCESLNNTLARLPDIDLAADIKQWLTMEIEDKLAELASLTHGTQMTRGTDDYPFSRIVRPEDSRGKSGLSSEYRSPLGKFLDAFTQYYRQNLAEFHVPVLGDERPARKLLENFRIIRDLVGDLNSSDSYDKFECDQVPINRINQLGYRDLFERLDNLFPNDRDKILAKIVATKEIHNDIRTLLFAAYLCRRVVLTLVTTEDEGAAFDIFDSLNTTGEPLTALETLKPRVIQFELGNGIYSGSKSHESFERLDKHFAKHFVGTKQKQTETKELIVNFAMYIDGKKMPEQLAAQRSFLRGGFDKAKQESKVNARRFVSSIADVAEFRNFYWTNKGISEIGQFHSGERLNHIQLLISLVREMNTKLALPILARYWSPNLNSQGSDQFEEAIKALVAFLILRRAASGGTANIDSDFRAIMAEKNGSAYRFDLRAGVTEEKQPLDIGSLKAAFRTLLLKSKFRISDKSKWVDQVIDNPLYSSSKPLVRFMLLTAAHQATPSTTFDGCWDKEEIRASTHTNNFLSFDTWTGDQYSTVEHVAPQDATASGWDPEIYKNTILRNTIGNLVLLPAKENGAIGNHSWKRKKTFYMAVTEKTKAKQEAMFERATAQGMQFTDYTKELLKNGNRLEMLDPIRDVKDWDTELIKSRGRNTAELTWDHLWPWLE